MWLDTNAHRRNLAAATLQGMMREIPLSDLLSALDAAIQAQCAVMRADYKAPLGQAYGVPDRSYLAHDYLGVCDEMCNLIEIAKQAEADATR